MRRISTPVTLTLTAALALTLSSCAVQDDVDAKTAVAETAQSQTAVDNAVAVGRNALALAAFDATPVTDDDLAMSANESPNVVYNDMTPSPTEITSAIVVSEGVEVELTFAANSVSGEPVE